MLDAEHRGPQPTPDLRTLRERLARPRVATPWRIEGIDRPTPRVVLAAQYKSGKTTLRDNLVRALVDGEAFWPVSYYAP